MSNWTNFLKINIMFIIIFKRYGHQDLTVQRFTEEVAIPMVYSLVGEVTDAFHCSDVLQAFSVFHLKMVPDTVAEVVNGYGEVHFIPY